MNIINVLIIGNNNINIIRKSFDNFFKDKYKILYKIFSSKDIGRFEDTNQYHVGFIFIDDTYIKSNKTKIIKMIGCLCEVVIVIGFESDVISNSNIFEYINFPINPKQLVVCFRRISKVICMHNNIKTLQNKCIDSNIALIGSSHEMRCLRVLIEKTANSFSRVMITGAPGSGKKTTAKLIYKNSLQSNGDFVILNPSRYSNEELNEKIFNTRYDQNIFQKASGGFLYIEDFTEISPDIQTKMLNFIHSTQFNAQQNNESKVRIMTSSSRDIASIIKKGMFREDLYYRLCVIPIRVPSLVERIEDIEELSTYFIDYFFRIFDIPSKKLDKEIILMMQTYHWPYNVLQLKNMVEWMLIVSRNSSEKFIKSEIFSPIANVEIINNTTADIISMPIKKARHSFEKKYLKAQINRFGGNVSKTAEFIKMERSALHRKLKALGVLDFKAEDRLV